MGLFSWSFGSNSELSGIARIERADSIQNGTFNAIFIPNPAQMPWLALSVIYVKHEHHPTQKFEEFIFSPPPTIPLSGIHQKAEMSVIPLV